MGARRRGPCWYMPKFQNLRSLHLIDMEDGLLPHNVVEIGEVLLRSPGLRELGLSYDVGYYRPDDEPCLLQIIQHYHAQRMERKLPLLKLVYLFLGNNFLPSNGLEIYFDGNNDYLSLLTDLSSLRSLKLRNFLGMAKFKSGYYEGFHPEAFQKSHCLRNLSVVFFTKDVARLIVILSVHKELANLSIPSAFADSILMISYMT